MKALIQTFYDVSVIDAKEVTPVREDFNLTNFLINLITENAPALEAKGLLYDGFFSLPCFKSILIEPEEYRIAFTIIKKGEFISRSNTAYRNHL